MGSCSRSPSGLSDLVCEDVPRTIFLNALSDKLPECDRKEGMSTLSELTHADMCYVYCAQRSCGAATAYMQENEAELREKCSMITYLHNGALGMERDHLVDGATCHRKITDANLEKGVRSTCLTCDENDGGATLPMTVDGAPVPARLVSTRGEIPDWYRRSGILSSLPTQFSCDDRYRAPPTPHEREDATMQVEVDIGGTDLPSDAVIAYWAAHESDEVYEAAQAYGTFDNSGIARCRQSKCRFALDHPGMYTANGVVYKPHIHFTEWVDGSWNTTAKTIEF